MPFPTGHRYVFVGGLHRSGTSLVARLLGTLPGVGGITDAPVPENEGAYLQGGIPHHARSGIPRHFATDPTQHLTEDYPLNRFDTRQRMVADWDTWFPKQSIWRVEKSPVNLTRMRLLQQLFPMAHFVVVIRHPEAVAAAVAKWIERPASVLIDYWLAAHDQLRADLDYIHAVSVVRYEDVTNYPTNTLTGLATFLDCPNNASPSEPIRNGNADYAEATMMSAAQARRARDWGYEPGLVTQSQWRHPTRHPLRHIREATDAANAQTNLGSE